MSKVIKLKNNIFLNGEICDMGSNTNGNYVKYANGLMICYAIIPMSNFTIQNYHGYTYTWTYPASFKANAIVLATPNEWTTNDSSVKAYADISTCSMMYFLRNPYSKEYTRDYTSGNISAIAIGKWK